MNISERMTKARTRLLLDHPWFGSLAMRLKIEPDAETKTFATDGTTLRYNSEFAAKLPDAELTAILAHEVMHCALLHPYRRGTRSVERWNKATDYAINAELIKAGFVLPEDRLYDAKFEGLSADVIYAQLGDDEPDENGGNKPNEQPLSTGSVDDAPQPEQGDGQSTEPAEQPTTAEDWKIATEQATAVSKAAGNVPGGAVRAAKKARESVEDWRAALREFVEHQTPSDYTWNSPNRRHIADGLYLPGIYRENLGTIAVAVDTSGSISQQILDAFAAELTNIVQEARPERVEVVYCDYDVQHTEEFTPDDPEISLKAYGGGGTRFGPVFDRLDKSSEPPIACIYFTDLENGSEQLKEPEYPVLWCTGLRVTKSGPFGRTVRVDLHERG